MLRSIFALVAAILFSSALAQCPPEGFDAVEDFDLTKYLGTWYSLAQLPVFFQPESQLNCVFAEYQDNVEKSLWCSFFGCTEPPAFSVFNSGRVNSVNGAQNTIRFVATIPDQTNEPAKGSVGPGGISTSFRDDSTNYWVVATGSYSDLGISGEIVSDAVYQYAIITSGPPDDQGADDLCYSGGGGMWFFTRDPIPPVGTKEALDAMALNLGLDSSVLVETLHEGCSYDQPGFFGGVFGSVVGFADIGFGIVSDIFG